MSKEAGVVVFRQDRASVACVHGMPFTEMPQGLYIPPDALEVFLETFTGPLDLLLYLIKQQNINVLDIPIAKITEQYMRYIELMEIMQLELAGEYLLMAAMLAEIKSRMLLPSHVEDEEEQDPRAELIRRLQQYEQYKDATDKLDKLPRTERDFFTVVVAFSGKKTEQNDPDVSLDNILCAFSEIMKRTDMFSHHRVQREHLSVRERMSLVLDKVHAVRFIRFTDLFHVTEGRGGVIVSFLAILELVKESLILMIQNESNGPIYVKAAK